METSYLGHKVRCHSSPHLAEADEPNLGVIRTCGESATKQRADCDWTSPAFTCGPQHVSSHLLKTQAKPDARSRDTSWGVLGFSGCLSKPMQ